MPVARKSLATKMMHKILDLHQLMYGSNIIVTGFLCTVPLCCIITCNSIISWPLNTLEKVIPWAAITLFSAIIAVAPYHTLRINENIPQLRNCISLPVPGCSSVLIITILMNIIMHISLLQIPSADLYKMNNQRIICFYIFQVVQAFQQVPFLIFFVCISLMQGMLEKLLESGVFKHNEL